MNYVASSRKMIHDHLLIYSYSKYVIQKYHSYNIIDFFGKNILNINGFKLCVDFISLHIDTLNFSKIVKTRITIGKNNLFEI